MPVSTGHCRLCGMGTGTVRDMGSSLCSGCQCRWLVFRVLDVRWGGLISSRQELLSAPSWFLPAARCPACWESSPACWESSPGRHQHQSVRQLKDGCTVLPRGPLGAIVTGHFRFLLLILSNNCSSSCPSGGNCLRTTTPQEPAGSSESPCLGKAPHSRGRAGGGFSPLASLLP